MRNEGTTLVELIVVVAILGLVFGVSGLAFMSLRTPRGSEWARALSQARSEAIRRGQPIRAVTPSTQHLAPLFLPDGRAIGVGADPLTGAPLNGPK
jgi:Tfp pilus assembly protein FimT